MAGSHLQLYHLKSKGFVASALSDSHHSMNDEHLAVVKLSSILNLVQDRSELDIQSGRETGSLPLNPWGIAEFTERSLTNACRFSNETCR